MKKWSEQQIQESWEEESEERSEERARRCNGTEWRTVAKNGCESLGVKN